MSLEQYRAAVAPLYRAVREARDRRMLDLAGDYMRAKDKTSFAVEDVVDWGMAEGRLTKELALQGMVEDALYGYPADFEDCAKPDLLFLWDHARLVRAVEEVRSLGEECPSLGEWLRGVEGAVQESGVDATGEEVLVGLVVLTWRELTEMPRGTPFPWPKDVVLYVAAAVWRGDLSAE